MTFLLENYIFKNWKIKTYALGVSLVLWFVILGQRSLVVSREVNVEYLVSEGMTVQDSVEKTTLTISAKRSVLQSFNPQNYAPVVDLRGLPPGSKRLFIKTDSIEMPIGARLLDIKPKLVTLYLKNEPKPLTNQERIERSKSSPREEPKDEE
jgi:hypothetical protein